MTWSCYDTLELDNSVHVIPDLDIIEHDQSDDCVCGPAVEPVPLATGGMSWLVTHHSLDGREADE
ncbi:hypothetical protein BH762_gp001 [Gordonia phage OneUp]|uniref:Uncharacterized protein n=1 Tax=Gordonia phage OneUp TaxID=1838074 RepID=A0A160DH94_9CAUD|nr:hypothetical protein BH762_gp001 [Gordonia phage OneUp]ANA86344.1 hypothetical protein PBI_ONEUP_1 [Gordonia phage OneUp]